MNSTNSEIQIVLLICWHGNFPWYFPYFLHSCRYNPDIDFLIFTDNQDTSIFYLFNRKLNNMQEKIFFDEYHSNLPYFST